MKLKHLKVAISLAFAVILLSVAFSFSVFADITAENNAIVGLDPSKSYSYASVTLENYESPNYTAVSAGSERIDNLSAGIYLVMEAYDAEPTAVWVEGDPAKRASIGTLNSNGASLVRENVNAFKAGIWTGIGAKWSTSFTFATPYFLSATAEEHVSSKELNGLMGISGYTPVTQEQMRQDVMSVVYKYAYAPEEIIPVEELISMRFTTGVRTGPLKYSGDNPSIVIKVYTMNKNGSVNVHTKSFETSYGVGYAKKVNSTVYLLDDFPNATGWVVGVEVYPFGIIPDNYSFSGNTTSNTQTAFFVEYSPAHYVTTYFEKDYAINYQYNGANTAYIDGYGDGTFRPDDDISRAEAVNILAKLISNSEVIPSGYISDFADISVSDWYYDAFAYVESFGILDYIQGSRVKPNENITRGEFIQLLANSVNYSADSCTFTDVDETTQFYSAICALASKGIINGYEDGSLRPLSTLTRAEAVALFNRLVNLLVNDNTLEKEKLENTFSDTLGHWAENDILMASNNNVKSKNYASSSSGLSETDKYIVIETDHVVINLSKYTGSVASVTNKYDNSDITAKTASPWFTYLTTDTGATCYPVSLQIIDGRLRVIYSNGTQAYFIVECFDNYFTVELDSKVPEGVSYLYFGKIAIANSVSSDPETYRISAVTMNINTAPGGWPGASNATSAYVQSNIGSTMGGKLGITFSKFGGNVDGEHRQYLKEIVLAIDEKVGIKSTKGAAFTYDNDDLFYDYILTFYSPKSSTQATTIADLMNDYSIEQLDLHQGGNAFIQGDFNFTGMGSVTGNYWKVYTPASEFKTKIADTLTSKGIQLSLHTYSMGVDARAETILSNPKWQKQISYNENLLTLESDVTPTSTVFTTDDTSLITIPADKVPYYGKGTKLFLIDEEIVEVSSKTGTSLTVKRGTCGTTATTHSAGAKIKQLNGYYEQLQPIPGSELFYHIADLTAKAYNEGGFEMIYLDGLEGFTAFAEDSKEWYYYASFVHRIISGCETTPIIEMSVFYKEFWAARARAGAWDFPRRQYNQHNLHHLNRTKSYLNYFCTSTLGWFDYAPDRSSTLKNTFTKTMFKNNLDYMGTMAVAFDLSTTYQDFSSSEISTYPNFAHNSMYYSLYSRLRKAGYFSPSVKAQLQQGILNGKDYRLEELSDGSWAFREMSYLTHKVFDLSDTTFATKSFTNPYSAQTPYIRVEQLYSTLGKNEITVLALDETKPVSELATTHSFTAVDMTSVKAIKMDVYGNGSTTDAIMVSFNYHDLLIPLNFSGWREIILIESDTDAHDGYNFTSNYYLHTSSKSEPDYRANFNFKPSKVKITLCGSCEGVYIDDIRASTIVSSPAVNPSIKIGTQTIVFNTTLRSGEYIEYYPELGTNGEAYIHKYNYSYTNGYNGNDETVSQISFSGSVSVPAGAFNCTYSATKFYSSNAPLRAQVVIGLKSSDLIENEDTWSAELPELPNNIQYVTIS